MTNRIGKLERVAIRELWKHEERGFSKWLFENPDILDAVLGFSVVFEQREKWLGAFKVDLVGQTEAGELLVVENQLEPSNHDHLGKLLTYAANFDAKVAIWIVTSARPEHVVAVTRLNESTDLSFFLLRMDAYRIGDSPAAPLLTLIVGPSESSKAIGKEKKELADRHLLRIRFWERLLNRAKQLGCDIHANRAPGKENWIGAGAGRSGLTWTYVVWMDDRSAVELYIDAGDTARNKARFDWLFARRESIDRAFGGPLEWERLDDGQASRIRYTQRVGGLRAPEGDWQKIHDPLIDAMKRLVASIGPYVPELPD